MVQIVSVIIVLWNIVLSALLVYIWWFIRSFFPNKKRGLHNTIKEAIHKNEKTQHTIEELRKTLDQHIDQSRLYYQKMGIVRFNPFDRVGGEQSYTLALLNQEDSGIVLTFLYMREGVRVYVKRVMLGRGEKVDLSQEEQKAIVKAQGL